MRIKNGDTNRFTHFVAVDLVDLFTRELSLTNLAVWYELDNGGKVNMTTPTATHLSDGVYRLNIDEVGMVTIVDAGIDEQELVLHITADEINPVDKIIEIYRSKITAGYTLGTGDDGDLLVCRVNNDMRGTNAADFGAAMKAITGITEGGTWTWEKIMKITTAWAAGDWRVKPTDSTKQELMDAEDGITVILEQTLTRSPAVGDKYKDITVKI